MTLSTIFQFLPRNFLNKNILISVLGLLFVGFVSVIFSESVEEYIGPFSGLSHQKNEILTILGFGMSGILLTLFRKYMMIFLMIFLISILGLFFVGFVSVMFSVTFEQRVGPLLGLSEQKNEILTFLGIGMGGVLVALQALMSYIRAKAMEETANAQIKATEQQVIANQNTQKGLQQERLRMDETAIAQARANQNTENGLRQERLKNAIEHLGNASDSVRLGGAYELFHLAQDTKKEALQRMCTDGADERFHLAQDTPDLRQTVLDILCAHIRRTTGEDEYRKMHQSKPSQEVQSLLTLLFVQDHDVFEGLPINLQESWLNGADLQKARLQKAILKQANLRGARLDMAHLQEANLVEAHLEEIVLIEAGLQGANVKMAKLQGATLTQAHLEGADFWTAHLQAANLLDAHLQGANLASVRLQGAILSEARMQGANLSYTQMQGAILRKANLKGAGTQDWTSSTHFAECIKKSICKKSDLSTVSSRGICQRAADALEEGLSDEKAKILREMLGTDIDKPFCRGLPKNSDAITGTYTKEEAEKWIAEYEEVMSEVPTSYG